ncbi:MAG: amidohydrolase family protein, partial [Thermosphaera sp.]
MPLVKAESVLIGNGRVLAAGDYERLARLPSVKEELVSKKPLGPGFIDAHLHLDSLGFELYSEKLVVDNIRSLIESLKNKEPMVGGWLLPGRVDPSKLKENRLPTRLELDEISREKPILIIHQSGHMGALNTKGLKMVLEVMGKRSEIDYERGYVYETSLWGILDFIRRTATDKDLEEFFERAYELLREKGISAIGLAG